MGTDHYCCRCYHQETYVQAQFTTHTPQGACAACHRQGPMIQGQLPQENTQRASGCCNLTLASAAPGSPHIPNMTTVLFPLPSLSEQQSPNQLLL